MLAGASAIVGDGEMVNVGATCSVSIDIEVLMCGTWLILAVATTCTMVLAPNVTRHTAMLPTLGEMLVSAIVSVLTRYDETKPFVVSITISLHVSALASCRHEPDGADSDV